MHHPPAAPFRSVLIVEADRLYSTILAQSARRAFRTPEVVLAHSVDRAASQLATQAVDVVIAGLGASLEGDVFELLAQARALTPRPARILVVITSLQPRVLTMLRTLEIDAVLDSCAEPPKQLVTALTSIVRGQRYWSPSILQELQHGGEANALFHVLSAFEQLVLSIIGDGCDDAAAAHLIGVSPATIATVRRDLHRKLHVQHRGELVRIAAQNGFVRFTSTGVVRPGFAALLSAYHARRLRRLPAPTRLADREIARPAA